MKKNVVRVLFVLAVLAAFVWMIRWSMSGNKTKNEKKRTKEELSNDYTPYFIDTPSSLHENVNYTYVKFGKYPQTKIKKNELTDEIVSLDYDEDGFAKSERGKIYRRKNEQSEYDYYRVEDIVWKVIADSGDCVTLWADTIIDARPYAKRSADDENHAVETIQKWSESYLYKWLNEDFYNLAFTIEEKTEILSQQNENYSSDFGYPMKEKEKYLIDKTEDKVAVRDGYELSLYQYECPYKFKGQEGTVVVYSETPFLKCNSSDYAMDLFKESVRDTPFESMSYIAGYWTRTPISNTDAIIFVQYLNDNSALVQWSEDMEGMTNQSESILGVRPVIKIKKSEVKQHIVKIEQE